jgi:REP element-mobilizing transposase RayT
MRTLFRVEILLRNPDHEGGEQVRTCLTTWHCYGSWLPGQAGAVPRTQNKFNSPVPEANQHKERHARGRTRDAPYTLDETRRQIVRESLQEVRRFRGWSLFAAHVRTTHVHVVVSASSKPEAVMVAMKAYSSRALNRLGIEVGGHRWWARHGSTRYLWGGNRFGRQSGMSWMNRVWRWQCGRRHLSGELRSRGLFPLFSWTPSPR